MQNSLAIIGPTSVGKTSLALKLCKKFDGQIISVDSRQVYKYMDIGTGKKPLDLSVSCKKGLGYWILDGIKVWGYDLVNPCDRFSVNDFVKFVCSLDLKEKFTIFVGGTGFYFDVLFGQKQVAGVKPNQKLRNSLVGLSAEELYDRLYRLNSSKAQIIDRKNPVRLIRAIEIESAYVHNIKNPDIKGWRQNRTETKPVLKNCLAVGLTAGREVLYDKVDRWVDKVYGLGLIDEVKELVDKGYESCDQLRGLNYNHCVSFMYGNLSKEEAILKTKNDNHAYIRRQQTYFKKMLNLVWFDVAKEGFDKDLERLVQSKVINE